MEDSPAGICQQRDYKGTPTTPSLWEGKRKGETWAEVLDRHREARILCFQCPLLDACEAALSDHERQGDRIDGIMAARYCDIAIIEDLYQEKCAACSRPLVPQYVGPQNKRTYPKGAKRHVGEALCHECHEQFSRAALRTHHH